MCRAQPFLLSCASSSRKTLTKKRGTVYFTLYLKVVGITRITNVNSPRYGVEPLRTPCYTLKISYVLKYKEA